MSVFNGYLTDTKPSDKVTMWASTRGLGDSEGGYVSKHDLALYCPRGLTAFVGSLARVRVQCLYLDACLVATYWCFAWSSTLLRQKFVVKKSPQVRN